METGLREQFTENLKQHGKELLKDPGLSDEKMAQAVYWKHGIGEKEDSPMIASTVKAVREKDLGKLLERIGNNSQNPASQEVFERMTDIKLGKTQKARVAQLSEWAGTEKVQALRESNAQKARDRDAQRLRDGMVSAWSRLQWLLVRGDEGQTLTG